MEHQSSSSVKLVEVCRVAPLPPSPDSPTPDQSLPLTFFDLLWLRFAPVQRLYFYETTCSSDSILPKLKTSLSLSLQHFVPLAGNLTWPQDSHKPILSYVQGDAVSLTVAESAADFHRLSNNNIFLEANEYHPLLPQLDASHEKAAAMALQITVFPNQGFSIGTVMHHAILDGKTSTSFVKSWAHVCKNGDFTSSSALNIISLPDHLNPFYDRRVVQDPTGIGEINLKDWQNMDGPNNRSLMFLELKPPPDSIRATFEFTRAKIQTLRQSVMTTMAEKNQQEHQALHLSTFSLAIAYTWVCLVKAQKLKGQKTVLMFTVDCRFRLDPPIPATYFGNCISGRAAVAETKGLLGEDGLVVAVTAISKAIKSLDEGVLDGLESGVSKLKELVQTAGFYSTAGSHRFEIYGTDFGWGRPRRVEVVSIDRTGAISISDSRNGGGGVEVGLVLKEHHMEAFASLFAKGLEEH